MNSSKMDRNVIPILTKSASGLNLVSILMKRSGN